LKVGRALAEESKRLRVEVATLKSYARIEKFAIEELGMSKPHPDQVMPGAVIVAPHSMGEIVAGALVDIEIEIRVGTHVQARVPEAISFPSLVDPFPREDRDTGGR
jgi:hypothetical protein